MSSNTGFAYVPKAKRTTHVEPETIVLQDGLVLLKNIVSPQEQQKLMNISVAYGQGKHPAYGSFYTGKFIMTAEGFADTDLSANTYSVKKPNTSAAPQSQSTRPRKNKQLNLKTKARMSIPMNDVPKEFSEANTKYLNIARKACPSIPASEAKVCRINYYTRKGKIGWHCDRDGLTKEQQKTVKSPIISFSLGSSCVFKYKDKREDDEKQVTLSSGDVLIFGGPSRMIFHAVTKIMPKSSTPRHLKITPPFDGRINIGFY